MNTLASHGQIAQSELVQWSQLYAIAQPSSGVFVVSPALSEITFPFQNPDATRKIINLAIVPAFDSTASAFVNYRITGEIEFRLKAQITCKIPFQVVLPNQANAVVNYAAGFVPFTIYGWDPAFPSVPCANAISVMGASGTEIKALTVNPIIRDCNADSVTLRFTRGQFFGSGNSSLYAYFQVVSEYRF